MTMIGLATRPSDESDPRRTQRRIAVSPSGRQTFIEITSGDRLRLIAQLPGRWPDVIKARERGESLEQIHRWAHVPLNPIYECVAKCDPPCLRDHIAGIYAWLETELHALAMRRARLHP